MWNNQEDLGHHWCFSGQTRAGVIIDFTSQFEKNNESREHKFIDRKISSCCLYATSE